jgi:hypothetical protein
MPQVSTKYVQYSMKIENKTEAMNKKLARQAAKPQQVTQL